MSDSLVTNLQAVVGAENVLTEREDLIVYSFDGTAALSQLPRCVAFPANTEEVAACVTAAADASAPIIARGSGTGLSGGSVPVPDGVVMCLTRLNHVLEIDAANLCMRVEAGVITQRVDERAAEQGLFYPPDPGSLKTCTIGGNVAENSGGLRGLKYGVTRDYVMGMQVVLADGRTVWLGNKCVKDVAGYNLRDLFIGSEGTLGIVTEVLLRLLPRPEHRVTLMATYADMRSAAQAVSDIIANRIVPCTLEFLDQTTIRCVEDFASVQLPTEAGAMLLVECDGRRSAVEAELTLVTQALQSAGAVTVEVAENEAAAERLRTARRSAFAALARVRPTTILEDVTVPRSHLAEMVEFIGKEADRRSLRVGVFGHMGDGNLHPTFLTDERDEQEMHRVEEALEAIVDKTISLGGSVTGEHGVGLAKKPFLRRQIGDDSFALMQSIKATLDPEGLLNPGKIFDPHRSEQPA
ncbi:MAG: FAD-linked oxidase C-terminal domain-containing protein [Planctomycetota bacterium]